MLLDTLLLSEPEVSPLFLWSDVVCACAHHDMTLPSHTDAVSKHKLLKQIYLRGNPLDSSARSALEKVAQHHPSLVIFV
jgi:hypothetical protein